MANNTGQFSKVIVTATGKDMIAKSQGGQILRFTRVALGDGLVAPGEDPVNYTSIKNERLSVPIAKYSNLNNGQFEIQFRVSNQTVTEGFWHREIGIMAKIDNGAEELYAYTTAGNTASYIYDKTAPVDERVVNVTFVIGNATNLDVVIDNSVIYLTKKDYEKSMAAHENNSGAHGNAMQKHNGDTSAHSAAIKAHNNDASAHSVAIGAHDDDSSAHAAAIKAHNENLLAHSDMVGAAENINGKRGMVPAPKTNDRGRFLRGDGKWIDVSDTTPVGDVVYRPYLRAGYVKANGATVNRADYPNLVSFATDNNLWTDSPSTEPWKYGRGNGSTTMVLPDYRNRFIQGGDNVITIAAGLPQVNLTTAEAVQVQEGTVAARTAILETPNNGYGAVANGYGLSKSAGVGLNISGNYSVSNALKLVAQNAIYGSSSTVQPPAIVLIPQLRY